MTSKRQQTWLGIGAVMLVLCSVIINIKNIFTSCQVDAEYQVAMAYRILQGDRMFSEMWEAHQTSAFFLAFFEWIFLKVSGSTTGIMLYANAVGVVCKTAVAFCVYGTLRKFADKKTAFAALLFALNAYPKDIVLPDFANLQIWFGLLLMCCLMWYFGQQKKIWLILGAVCLCLEVLAYPSCALVWILCVVLIRMYSRQKFRDTVIFTGVCGIGGVSYLLYFMRGNPGQFLQYLYYIWSGDESHAVGLSDRLVMFGKDLLLLASDMRYLLIVFLCAYLAAWVCSIVSSKKGTEWTKRKMFYTVLCWILTFYILGYLVHLPEEDAGTKYHFFLLYLLMEAAAWMGRKYLDAPEKRIFMIGQLVALGGFAATLLLSDMGLFSAFPYLIPGVCVSMLPIGKIYEKGPAESTVRKACLPALLLCAVMIFRNFIYLNGWMSVPENFREDSIFGVTWTADYGPLKGIVNGDGAYVADVSYLEWQDMIRDGDKVLVLSYPTLNATLYLYKDVEICADSTISTPTYSERLLAYWEENPEKYPNVVVVKCFNGSPMMGEYNRITKWLEEEFPAKRVVDGSFWRYYFLE